MPNAEIQAHGILNFQWKPQRGQGKEISLFYAQILYSCSQFRPFTIQFMNRNVAVIIISIMSTKARFHTFFSLSSYSWLGGSGTLFMSLWQSMQTQRE